MILPLLLAACASDPAPPDMPETQVVLFSSDDLHTWERAPRPLARDLMSLGLDVRDDGELRVTGVRPGQIGSWWDRAWGRLRVPGLVYRDGSWSETSWSLRDPDAKAIIDPQWLGDDLWYMTARGEGGDPLAEHRVNRFRSSPSLRTWYQGPGVGDPSPVWFQGALHLFFTGAPARVVHLVLTDAPDDPTGQRWVAVQEWAAVTVPFALVHGDELWLLVQHNLDGRRHPMLARSTDGIRFSEFEPLLDHDAVMSCTSPVLGPRPGGGWFLLCVDEEGEGAPGRGRSPSPGKIQGAAANPSE